MIYEYIMSDFVVQSKRPATLENHANELATLGAKGWELVSMLTVVPDANYRGWFKRPKVSSVLVEAAPGATYVFQDDSGLTTQFRCSSLPQD